MYIEIYSFRTTYITFVLLGLFLAIKNRSSHRSPTLESNFQQQRNCYFICHPSAL